MPPRWRPPLRDVVSIMPFSFQELAIPGIHHAFMRDMAGKRDDGEYQSLWAGSHFARAPSMAAWQRMQALHQEFLSAGRKRVPAIL